MSPDHQTSERVYNTLKQDIMVGRIDAGLVNIAALSRRYESSATPVREALLRLVGEGLVELRTTGGFAVPAMTQAKLRALYDLSARLALAAIAWPSPDGATGVADRNALIDPPIDRFFLDLAARTGNPQFLSVMTWLNDQLARIRMVEARYLKHLDKEYDGLTKAHGQQLRRAIVRYHARRLQRIEAFVARSTDI